MHGDNPTVVHYKTSVKSDAKYFKRTAEKLIITVRLSYLKKRNKEINNINMKYGSE
jgi:hypothetical protein